MTNKIKKFLSSSGVLKKSTGSEQTKQLSIHIYSLFSFFGHWTLMIKFWPNFFNDACRGQFQESKYLSEIYQIWSDHSLEQNPRMKLHFQLYTFPQLSTPSWAETKQDTAGNLFSVREPWPSHNRPYVFNNIKTSINKAKTANSQEEYLHFAFFFLTLKHRSTIDVFSTNKRLFYTKLWKQNDRTALVMEWPKDT